MATRAEVTGVSPDAWDLIDSMKNRDRRLYIQAAITSSENRTPRQVQMLDKAQRVAQKLAIREKTQMANVFDHTKSGGVVYQGSKRSR